MKTPGQQIIEDTETDMLIHAAKAYGYMRGGCYGFCIGALLTFIFMVFVTR